MWLAVVRDIAIVLLAIESVVIGILLLATLVQVRKLVSLLRDEVKPMLESANETVRTVRGTTSFVSQNVVDPLIKAKSFSAGTVEALRNLAFVGRKVGRAPKDR